MISWPKILKKTVSIELQLFTANLDIKYDLRLRLLLDMVFFFKRFLRRNKS